MDKNQSILFSSIDSISKYAESKICRLNFILTILNIKTTLKCSLCDNCKHSSNHYTGHSSLNSTCHSSSSSNSSDYSGSSSYSPSFSFSIVTTTISSSSSSSSLFRPINHQDKQHQKRFNQSTKMLNSHLIKQNQKKSSLNIIYKYLSSKCPVCYKNDCCGLNINCLSKIT